MAIDVEFLVVIAEMLSKDTFDDKLFEKLMRTRGAKAFLEQEGFLGRKVNVSDIKNEMIKLLQQEDYEDKFQFYRIKKNITRIRDDIEYLRKNRALILEKALEKVYKIVPEEMDIRTEICLYVGEYGGGFTINRNWVLINYGKYIGHKEEFVNILSHELYHSRVIPLRYKINFLFKSILKKRRDAYNLLGKIIEEGIACLIQHGAILNRDDLSGNLTRRNLSHTKEQFEILNRILLDMRYGKFDKKCLKKINVYSLGYLMVTTIYNEMGVLPLDSWTMNLDFRGIIMTFNKLCVEKNLPYGFYPEAIEWLR